MKKMLLFSTFLIFTLFFVAPAQVSAQDILDVEVLPVGNINEVINGDTVAGGLRANPDRIYRLKRGAIYQVTEPLRINGNLNIIAADVVGDPNELVNRPPVLAPAILPDNSSPGEFFIFIGEGADVNLSDLYLLAVRADQNWLGWGTGVSLNANNISLKVRNVIFEGWSNAGVVNNAQWSKIDIQDSKFRNLQHTGAWFGGQPIMSGSPNAVDTQIVRNNTFFANNSYLWSIRGYDKHSVFEHNTIVYGIVNPLLIRQASNIHMKNNLWYAAHAFGGNPTHVIDGWFLNYPDTASSTIFRTRGLDSTSYWAQLWNGTIAGPEGYVNDEVGATIDLFDPAKRVVNIQNNYVHYPQALNDFIDAYNDTTTIADSIGIPNFEGGTRDLVRRTIYKSGWMSDYAKWSIDSLYPAVGTSVTDLNNDINTDPGFDAAVAGHINEVIQYIQEISTNKIDENTWHFLPESGNLYPPAWPLPENLAYSNASLQNAGTDGFAIGDLNWFPEQKAQWLTGVEKVDHQVPGDYELSDNYPNPFNPSTKINFALPSQGMVSLKVFNVLGQEVRSLVNEELNAGSYTYDFDASNLSSGIYFYTLSTNNFSVTKKMMLMK